jgi:uncharacterized repeat protein (TIGR03833 family)
MMKMTSAGATKRASIRPGMHVSIVLKADQMSGKLTDGVVKDILTNSAVHAHGIKVRLENGQIGRVKEIEV